MTSATPNSGVKVLRADDFLVFDLAGFLTGLTDLTGAFPDVALVLAGGLPAGFWFAAHIPGELLSKNRPHATAVAHCWHLDHNSLRFLT
jgi:hypothetical protein